jgi:hypothetical protein
MPTARAAACRTGLPSTGLPRTALTSTGLPREVLLRMALPRRELPRTALPLTVGPCRTGGLPPTVRRPTPAGPTVRPDLAGTGCRTDGGCRRAQTVCTGRRDRVRPAAPQAGIMGRGLPSRTITRTAGAGPAPRHRAVTLPAGRDPEAQARAVPPRAVPPRAVLVARVAPVPAFPAREALVREAALPRPARAGRARVRRTGGRRRLAGPVRPGPPGLPEPRGQAGQAGLRRCVSTRPPGRASRRRTDVTGPDRRRNHQAR